RLDMPAIAVGQLLPLGFALFTCDAELVPGELMLRHEFLGEFFGPRAKWKSGSDVSNRTALQAGDAVHIRAAPTELIIPVGRVRVREPDQRPTDVLVKVSLEVEGDLERMLAFAKEAHPAGNLSWGAVVEFSVDKVFIRSPSHTVWDLFIPGRAPGG